jgi:hypothetical protein
MELSSEARELARTGDFPVCPADSFFSGTVIG